MNTKGLVFPFALTLSALASPVIAQTSSGTLEEIVVTAQKRSEDLQDVPIAISAYTSATRDLLGITTIQDLTNFTPGLSYSTSLDRASLRGIGRQTNNLASDPGLATYNDGFYEVTTRSAARSPLLVDRIEILRGPQGTLYGRNSIGGTINVVSKQPTAEWYGEVRGSYDNWDKKVAEAAVSGPLTDWLRFRVAGNLTKQDEGYFKNVATGKDEGGVADESYVEAQVAADLGDSVDLWIKASLAEYDNHRRNSYLDADYDYARMPATYLAPAGAHAYLLTGSNLSTVGPQFPVNPSLNDPYEFATDTQTRNKLDPAPTFIAHLTWDAGPMNIKYVGGYSSYEYTLTNDYDNTNVDEYTIPCLTPGCTPIRYRPRSLSVYVEDKKYWSHELNVSSSGDGPVQWIVGAYLYDEKYQQPLYFPTENEALKSPSRRVGPGFVQTPGAAANPSGWIYLTDTHLHTTSMAAFSQVDWAITDQWKLTVGARYTEDKKRGTEYTRQLCWGLSAFYGCPDLAVSGSTSPVADVTDILVFHNAPPGTTGAATVDPMTGVWSRGLDGSWNATTGTAGVEWQPTTEALMYAKYSRGYKSGGFNSGSIVESPMTDPEYVDAYEIGWKQQLAQRVQVNASVFYYKYEGMQIPLSVIPPAGPTQIQFFNMDSVINKGVELETVWRPLDNLQVLLNYAYLDATIDKGCCFVDGVDPSAVQPDARPEAPPGAVLPSPPASRGQNLEGQTVPQSPQHKAALNVNYTFNFSPGTLNISLSDIWKDETYFSVFNRYYNLAPSYNQVDARMTWTSADDHYTIIAYGRNVLDDEGYDGASAVWQNQLPTAQPNVTRVIPRTIARTYSLTPPRTYGMELQYRF